MNELFNFIFCSLKESKMDIKSIERGLNHQRWFNRNAVIFLAATAGCIVFLGFERYKDNKKIHALTKEIKELKNKEGE